MSKREPEGNLIDEASGGNETNEINPVREDKNHQESQASGETAESQEKNQASGDSTQSPDGESLEDLVRLLHKQIKSSDWLQQNTAEKWVAENPQLAKDYMEAAKKS